MTHLYGYIESTKSWLDLKPAFLSIEMLVGRQVNKAFRFPHVNVMQILLYINQRSLHYGEVALGMWNLSMLLLECVFQESSKNKYQFETLCDCGEKNFSSPPFSEKQRIIWITSNRKGAIKQLIKKDRYGNWLPPFTLTKNGSPCKQKKRENFLSALQLQLNEKVEDAFSG